MEPGSIYHLYSHANGFEMLFNQEEDYEIFLEKIVKYISPIADIYSYSLMPNHFHFLTEMKTEEEIAKLSGRKTPEKFISRSIGNALSSFAQKMNHKYSRMGSLFKRNIGHRVVLDENDFCNVCHYIHANPVHHGFVKSMGDWRYSSYKEILGGSRTWLNAKTVLDYFDGREEYIKYHQREIDRKLKEKSYF